MAIASGYYAHSAITAVWAAILGIVCLFRIRRAFAVTLTTMFFRVTPGVLLYCILVIVEAVDFEGLYGIYSPAVPAAIRIVETDDLACCSFGAMHLILTITYSMDHKKIPKYVAWVFVVAAAFKFSIGLATAIAFLFVKEKRVLIYNDTALLVTFCVSIGIMIRLVWQVQSFLSSHLERVPSDILSESLVKMRRTLVITVLAAIAVPGFLIYNVIDHYGTGNQLITPPDSNVYRLGYSVWFKLVWASFLLWLSRPTNDTSHTEVDSKGISRTQTVRSGVQMEKQDSSVKSRSSNKSLDEAERPELEKQNSVEGPIRQLSGSEDRAIRKLSEKEDSGFSHSPEEHDTKIQLA